MQIDPGDYSDELGYVNPRTAFSDLSILFSPVLPISELSFGIEAGGFFADQVFALDVGSDANGSLTDVEWFPGGAEIHSDGEVGCPPAQDQRYLTNLHLGVFHVDERTDPDVPEGSGANLSGDVTLENNLMFYGRLGWSDGGAPIARRDVSTGVLRRPGFYDDLFGIGITVADPSDRSLTWQTTAEVSCRYGVSDNSAITADVQYLDDPGSSQDDTCVSGLRARINL